MSSGFYEPGHTYVYSGGLRVQCDAVTTHPETGESVAWGWRFSKSGCDPVAYGEDDWDLLQYMGAKDVTETGESR